MGHKQIVNWVAGAATSLLVGLVAAAPGRAQQATADVDPQRAAYYKAFAGKKLVYIVINQAGEHGKVWYKSLKDTLEPLGMTVELRDTKFETSAGAQAFSQAIAQDAAVIVAQNPDRSAYARLIQQAEKKGIYVVSLNMASSTPADGFVGPDWMAIAKTQVDASAEACKGKSGKISVVQGANNSAQNVLAMAAIRESLKAHPELQIVNDQSADWDTNKARDITSTVLKQHPDLCAVIGYWSGMDLGAAAAIREAGLQGKVYMSTSGSGLADTACDRIKDGAFDMYVSYNVPEQGVQLGTVVQSLISSAVPAGTSKGISYTPLTKITKQNVDKPGTCWTLDN